MISVITPGRQRALTSPRRYSLKNKLSERMIKQLLNSVIAKYPDLSVSRRSITNHDDFAQPGSVIANYVFPAFYTSAVCSRFLLILSLCPHSVAVVNDPS